MGTSTRLQECGFGGGFAAISDRITLKITPPWNANMQPGRAPRTHPTNTKFQMHTYLPGS
ncbi:hypothetical protein H5410_003062 [Solanum commersonii]|uniref:Uncharacterized protein n=1 Tax=Solanum commersonii TaxID=4109 RepID=A0A9J6B3R4_SOLCO|nr:hypothetical protein H5410_003062 [Solanum commersonii]